MKLYFIVSDVYKNIHLIIEFSIPWNLVCNMLLIVYYVCTVYLH